MKSDYFIAMILVNFWRIVKKLRMSVDTIELNSLKECSEMSGRSKKIIVRFLADGQEIDSNGFVDLDGRARSQLEVTLLEGVDKPFKYVQIEELNYIREQLIQHLAPFYEIFSRGIRIREGDNTGRGPYTATLFLFPW